MYYVNFTWVEFEQSYKYSILIYMYSYLNRNIMNANLYIISNYNCNSSFFFPTRFDLNPCIYINSNTIINRAHDPTHLHFVFFLQRSRTPLLTNTYIWYDILLKNYIIYVLCCCHAIFFLCYKFYHWIELNTKKNQFVNIATTTRGGASHFLRARIFCFIYILF